MGRSRKIILCSDYDCNNQAVTGPYCRLHYIKNWKQVVSERKLEAREKLNKYIENMSAKYPEEFVDMIKDDLVDESTFKQRLQELGFRRELEGSKNSPFNFDNIEELLDGLKVEED